MSKPVKKFVPKPAAAPKADEGAEKIKAAIQTFRNMADEDPRLNSPAVPPRAKESINTAIDIAEVLLLDLHRLMSR